MTLIQHVSAKQEAIGTENLHAIPLNNNALVLEVA